MEKLTISRLGEVKNVSGSKDGRPYNFNKVGFQTNEHPDRWYDFTFNGQSHGLEISKAYEFEVTPREYNGKTYYSAKLPKAGSVMMEGVNRKLDTIITKLDILLARTEPSNKVELAEPESWDFSPSDSPDF